MAAKMTVMLRFVPSRSFRSPLHDQGRHDRLGGPSIAAAASNAESVDAVVRHQQARGESGDGGRRLDQRTIKIVEVTIILMIKSLNDDHYVYSKTIHDLKNNEHLSKGDARSQLSKSVISVERETQKQAEMLHTFEWLIRFITRNLY